MEDTKMDSLLSVDSEAEVKEQKTKKSSRKKNGYGEMGNVQLTDEEVTKLKEQFPNDWQVRINKLDTYIATHTTKYKNHYLVIQNWAKRDPKPPMNVNPVPAMVQTQDGQQTQQVDPYLTAMWRLFTFCGKETDYNRQRLYADYLRSYDPAIVDKAVTDWVHSKPFVPSFSELIAKCKEQQEKALRIAWSKEFRGVSHV